MAQPARPRRAARPRPEAINLPGITPLTSTRLSDDLAGQIRRLIVSEAISEGSRLPPERDLAERFGASRPTVSQALRTLSLMGLVEIRRGSGAYVLRRPETMVTASFNLMLDLDEASVNDLMQLRLWLETLGVEHAAARAPALDGGEVDAIQAALDGISTAVGDASKWIAQDTVFHATVVRSANNPYLAAMYEGVHTAVLSYEFKYWVETESVPAWLRHTNAAEQITLHEPIARAVIGRDAEAARAAVLKHHDVMSEHLAAARRSAQQRRRRRKEQ
jgi:GntR family transcriptional regulator, transcriptional repressor for pyruvate dehydrogenase complex